MSDQLNTPRTASTASRRSYAILPGGLGPREHERIFELAEQGMLAGRIARTISRHPSTVQSFMYRSGLSAPQYRDRGTVLRNGRPIKPFDAEEDAFITDLRVKKLGLSEIARRTTERFSHPRTPHTIHIRLVMLAARETS